MANPTHDGGAAAATPPRRRRPGKHGSDVSNLGEALESIRLAQRGRDGEARDAPLSGGAAILHHLQSGGLTAPPAPTVSRDGGIQVHPSRSFTNQSVKIAVHLPWTATPHPRTLVLGLFRASLKDQSRPIFIRSLHFQGSTSTRVQVRAPKTIGEFEFRVYDELSPESLVLPAMPLTVAVNLPYFEESSNTLESKLDHAVATQDIQAAVAAIMAYARVLEAVPTLYPAHGARLSGLLTRLLELRWDMEEWHDKADDGAESSVHGALRSFLHTVEANRHVWDIVDPATHQAIDFAQRHEYCGVVDRYFSSFAAKQDFWSVHVGVRPQETTLSTWWPALHVATNVWMDDLCRQLMPDLAAFSATRQTIYERVSAVVQTIPTPPNTTVALDVFGSSNNFFGSMASDMDMCLVVQPPVQDPKIKQRLLQLLIARLPPTQFAHVDTARLTARIPIVMFQDIASTIECDVCVENALALRNTRLLRTYALIDPRVRQLAYLLKHWVKQRGINNAADGTLSSYGYILLLLHYLQRTEPPVLPVLQTLPPTWQGSVWDVSLCFGDVGRGGAWLDSPRRFFHVGAIRCGCLRGDPPCRFRSPTCALTERLDESGLPSVVFQGHETYFFDPVQDMQWQWLHQFAAANTQSVAQLWLGIPRVARRCPRCRRFVSVFRHIVRLRVACGVDSNGATAVQGGEGAVEISRAPHD
ncbi:hypothetical protein, variant 2 [Aphanomyces invadans]|uniref:Poly(A) RNA polymerase mitochondrial-like central palm domain-containing protein n=1 Tax=Aphanomyces invadans TaxID=157072 RepID=A0A024THN2_9STRA|nr:hypothetical protein, variant 2 [Aphanomyces invadans]ETV93101.1 hypothetical protein, variant 2 [Aphanomyces invadans]|eukprot:XP_008878370.1 hypothetical protein, variant 2 [Aphanomyces invadans]